MLHLVYEFAEPNYVLQRTPGTSYVSTYLRGPAPLNTALELTLSTVLEVAFKTCAAAFILCCLWAFLAWVQLVDSYRRHGRPARLFFPTSQGNHPSYIHLRSFVRAMATGVLIWAVAAALLFAASRL